MRVIAGTARSLPLKTVPSMAVRPTTDRTKETLFNILMPRIERCRFLDLYAGSGAIGIEALSRGAKQAVFVDNARDSQKCIEENLRFTKLTENAELIKGDVLSALHKLDGGEPFDIIFMDPPFEKGLEKGTLEFLSQSSLLAEGGMVIVEASKFTDFSYVQDLGYEVIQDKIYKKSRHLFLGAVKDQARK
ncbi:MAG: 16S rRNA (guanine(966)-N(2))-methyltransferase RsmD [Lachnospiraceae bacterium]|jgi:16S rRNA (guanine966-N2)-methyltransferase|nr:16S rRNA (guanine(966)-N(2))-methyltransferase RsmD [Lachnospiraceae bacterium]MCI1726731.1 16S rRNA (guanine(966)-N(2))-methyltransferase RsmD [Lachnospiraceae bacterium]